MATTIKFLMASYGGSTIGGPVTIYAVAIGGQPPATDTMIALSGTGMSVPASFTLPAGQAIGFFAGTITAASFSISGTASGIGVLPDSGGVDLASPVVGVWLPPAVIGRPTRGRVEWAGVLPRAATTVTLAATGATVPATVTLAANSGGVDFPLVATSASYTVSASVAGVASLPAAAGSAVDPDAAYASLAANYSAMAGDVAAVKGVFTSDRLGAVDALANAGLDVAAWQRLKAFGVIPEVPDNGYEGDGPTLGSGVLLKDQNFRFYFESLLSDSLGNRLDPRDLHYKGNATVVFTTGNVKGEKARIDSYRVKDHSTTATIFLSRTTPLSEIPESGSKFVII